MKIVAGMHRSGTSLLANFLHEAGGDLGDHETFYPADRWNAGGYFEQEEIINVNLNLIHGPFGKFAYLALPSNKAILKRGRKNSHKLRGLLEKYNGKIVKENRFCLTLPAWRDAGLKVTGVVICIRNPRDVVQSIWERNRVPCFVGFQLWLKHINRLLDNTADVPRCYFSYESALNQHTSINEFTNVLRFLSMDYDIKNVEALTKKVIKEPGEENLPIIKKLPPKIENIWQGLMAKHSRQFMG